MNNPTDYIEKRFKALLPHILMAPDDEILNGRAGFLAALFTLRYNINIIIFDKN